MSKKVKMHFWVLVRAKQVLSVNWGGYDSDSVYASGEFKPKDGDKVVYVTDGADLEARLAECEMHLAKVLPAAQSYRRLKLGFDTDEIFEAKNYLAKYPKEPAHD